MTDHFVANFTGAASSLVAYTPDVGAAMTSPSSQSNFWTWNWNSEYAPPGFNPMQHAWFKDGAGNMYFDVDNGWGGNGMLQINQNAVTPDYYLEAKIDWSAADNAAQCALCVRGIPAMDDEDNCNAGNLGLGFQIWNDTPTTGQHTLEFWWGWSDHDSWVSPSVDVDYDYPIPDVVTTNTNAVFRVEVEGTTLRAFVDGTLISTATYMESNTTLDTEKKAMFAFWPFGDVLGGGYKVDYLKAGDEFLTLPAGEFWQDFVKTVEA